MKFDTAVNLRRINIVIFLCIFLSDAHLNPVITVICILKKRIRPFAGLIYVLAQMSGAVLGALCVKVSIRQTDF